jgi:hypothetical protein
MSPIAIVALILGLLCGFIPAMLLVAPAWTADGLRRFPRNRLAALALTAVDLLWAGWIVYHAELGTYNEYKPFIFVLVPLAYALVVWAMPELLAARSLGGLLLLVPTPILTAIRWEVSWVRLVLVVLCYIMVVKGMMLVLSPYQFRRVVEWMLASRGRTRVAAWIGLVIAVVVVCLGLSVLH